MELIISSDVQFYFLCFLLCLFSTFLVRSIFRNPGYKSSTSSSLHLPPSPPSLPIIGHLHHLRPLLHKSFQQLSSKYGPLLYLRFGSYPCLLVSSPSMAEAIFKTHDAAFAARPVSSLGMDESLLFGNSGFIAAPYGDYWRFMKKLCITELLGQRQIERSRAIRHQEITKLLHQLVQSAAKSEVVDMGALFTKLTNNTICRMMMSASCSEKDDDADKIRDVVNRSSRLAAQMFLATYLGPLKKIGFWVCSKEAKEVTTTYDMLLERLLKEHEEKAKNNREDKDLMDILLEAFHDENAEFRITRAQMKAFFLDLFVAGTGALSETMKWAVAELINHPKIYKFARDEIERVVGKSRQVEETDIPNLNYVQAIVKETLRLRPSPAFIPRSCRANCKINGFDIPKDTPVAVNAYSIGRDPSIWENSLEFSPERFLVSSKTVTNKGQNFDFFPFGGGRRACPGKSLAYVLMNTTIASIIQCIDLKVIGEDGNWANKIGMEEAIGIAVTMASPLRCLPLIHFHPFDA